MSEEKSKRVLLLAELCEPFPDEAYEADDSRGFTLTGIKGAYVIERLNNVLGPCGLGWAYEITGQSVSEKEVNLTVSLRYRVVDVDGWSEPVTVTGNCGIVRDRLGDALKGALTDGIKKAASMIGVGKEAYKGEVGKKPAQAAEKKELPFTYAHFEADPEKFKRAGAIVFPTGKHEAEAIIDVDKADRGYIAWLSEQPRPDDDSPMLTAWAACRYFRAYRKWKEAQDVAS